jgi:hypothetical protein
MLSQPRVVHGELVDAAIHDSRGSLEIAVGAGKLCQLPEQSAIRRQPKCQTLSNRNSIRRKFVALASRELARHVLIVLTHVTHTEKIVEILAIYTLALPKSNQAEMELFGLLEIGRGEADGSLQGHGRVLQVAMELPGRAQISVHVEMVRMITGCAPEESQGALDLAEAEIKCAQVGLSIGRQRPRPGRRFEFGCQILITKAGGGGAGAGRRLEANAAQHALIEQEAAPLRRELGKGLAGIIEAGPSGLVSRQQYY